MATGTRRKKFSLYSEKILDYRGVKSFIIPLHWLSVILGIATTVIGALSYRATTSTAIPHINCTLTTNINDWTEFPMELLLLSTGVVLILTGISVTLLLCIVKCQKCGFLAIAWYLITAVCVTTWTVWSILYLTVVYPAWLENTATCDCLIVLLSLASAGYCGILTMVYLVVILVVIIYDCRERCCMHS